ncbi:MAG: hypothetical protein M1828_004521 [Chrysothrix sp. TS-e1954]|nr:MAG: hypothetical protein M1828_004521 [Chrysothrix sp. TS-e1954]
MLQTSLSAWLRSPQNAKNSLELKQGASALHHANRNCSDTQGPTHTTDAIEAPQTGSVDAQMASSRFDLPCNVEIVPCSEEHLQSFRRLNTLLLPIPYQNSFYKEILNDPLTASITRVAIWKEGPQDASIPSTTLSERRPTVQLVAGIRCRLLPDRSSLSATASPILYVSTIGTLAPFRGHAIASRLLDVVAFDAAERYGARKMIAHVWEANEEALGWYRKRGFGIVGREQDYYTRLAPKTAAWVVEKKLSATGILAKHGAPQQPSAMRQGS